MKIKKFLIYLSITSSIFYFTSCDPYGGFQYWINNQSDSTLYVIISDPEENIERTTIEASDKTQIMNFSTISGLFDGKDEFLNWCDSLAIFIDTIAKIEIKKDYLKRDSWQYEQEVTGMMGKAGENIYTLTVSNQDFK